MTASLLPEWAQIIFLVVQGIGVLVIGGVGARIAYVQLKLARVKLRHDLYDRRYAVFQAVRTLIAEVALHQNSTSETFGRFAVSTSDALFLFDDDMVGYLEAVRQQAGRLHSIRSTVINAPPGVLTEGLGKAMEAMAGHEAWLFDQVNLLTNKFRPFLQLDPDQKSTRNRR